MASKRVRANGEGSVYRRSDGRWEASLHVGYDARGKRVRRKRVARTMREANALLATMKRDAANGIDVQAAEWTVSDWLPRWLESAEVRPRTRQTYGGALKHILPVLGRHRLRELRAEHVEAYVRARLGEAKPQTVRNELTTLGRALQVAMMRGYVERNVVRLVEVRPKVERPERNPLTPEETRRLLAAAEGHEWRALFMLAAFTGMRRAEVLGLTWADVDLDAGTVRVDRTLVRYGGTFHRDDPKTRTSRRMLEVPPVLVDVLREHRRRQVEQRLAAPVWLNDWDLVFTHGSAGEPIEPRRLHDAFKALLKAAELRDVRFHDLRHGAATLLWEQGADLKEIQQMLGHSTVGITADVYTHFSDKMRRGIADKMTAALFS